MVRTATTHIIHTSPSCCAVATLLLTQWLVSFAATWWHVIKGPYPACICSNWTVMFGTYVAGTLSYHNHCMRNLQPPTCLPGALQELNLSHSMLQELPANLSHLTSLTALHLHNNSLTTLVTGLSSLRSLVLLDVSHNWLSGCRGFLSDLVTALPYLEVLRLDNVSDKQGTLVLPMHLGTHR